MGKERGLKCWLNGLKIGVKLAPLYGLKCWLNGLKIGVKLAPVYGQGKGLKCWLKGVKIGVKLAPKRVLVGATPGLPGRSPIPVLFWPMGA